MDELKIPMLVKSESRDDEETIFDMSKSCDSRLEHSGNMRIINIILIFFGLFSIAFIVSLSESQNSPGIRKFEEVITIKYR